MEILPVLIIILLAVGFFTLQAHRAHRRQVAIAAIAPQLGLEFLGDGNHHLPNVVWDFNLFSKGRSRQVRNVLRGHNNGDELFIFDYRYTTGSGKNSRTRTFTVALIWMNEGQLPAFSLAPKNVFHRIGCMFGYQDINFDGYSEFSEHFLLRGSDEYEIRSLFNHWLLTFYADKPHTCTEGIGKAVVYYHTKENKHPHDWSVLLNETKEVMGLLHRAIAG